MKDTPILFTADMLKLVRSDKKIHTRRLPRKQPPEWTDRMVYNDLSSEWDCYDREGRIVPFGKCPYGVKGDRIWVREPWATYVGFDNVAPRNLPTWRRTDLLERKLIELFFNKSQYESARRLPDSALVGRWRSPLHMPKWVARTILEVNRTWIEPVRMISEADSIKEGIAKEYLGADPDNCHPPGSYGYVSGVHPFPEGMIYVNATKAFSELWDSINGNRMVNGAPVNWHSDPWVWCVDFKVIATERVEQ